MMSQKTYSQSSLQDFVDCRRRYYYRRVLSLNWPTDDGDAADTLQERVWAGKLFHTLVHQFLVGVPIDDINLIDLPHPVKGWWKTFIDRLPISKTGVSFPEVTLTTLITADALLVARYDLIQQIDNEFLIFDWKTSSNLPKRGTLLDKLQTKVYPFTLADSGFFDGTIPISPENIKMTYWFVEYPDQPITVTYSKEQKEKDRKYLEEQILEISSLEIERIGDFHKTDNRKLCSYCEFSGLCERSDIVPDSDHEEEAHPFEYDFDFFSEDDI
ncbi:MAG: PD-(D/E)XK nuclease family protein [Anaerolineales bacterium]|nr:PD-(D/E)XK nuclease family protein [Anaerolineales bacterium]